MIRFDADRFRFVKIARNRAGKAKSGIRPLCGAGLALGGLVFSGLFYVGRFLGIPLPETPLEKYMQFTEKVVYHTPPK